MVSRESCKLAAATDEEVRRALRDLTVQAILPALAQLTGELSILREDLRPDPSRILEPDGGISEDQRQRAEQVTFEALARWREAGCPSPPPLTPDTLRRLMAFVVGEGSVDEFLPLLREELAVEDDDLRAPGWRKNELAPEREFTVAVVGAGMSGIAAGHRLRQAGVEFTIFEKNNDVGGTWLENTYPGCRVDVPNHLYSYSFAQIPWRQHFSCQTELLDYFRRCAEDLGVRDRTRFGCEVRRAQWDDERALWRITLESRSGQEVVEANALISAVGQLNRPHIPSIEGRERFAGPQFHSASWDASVDLRGKRVVVVGTGASAAQFVPLVAEQAAQLTILQRTPNWLLPVPHYHEDVPAGAQWLQENLPFYGAWYRLFLFWRMHEGLLPAAAVDPAWEGGGASVSALNDLVRQMLTAYLAAEFADRPDLLAKVVPSYPPIAKRIVLDNGVWARALKRDNVSLVIEPIERITPEGVRTTDGTLHRADVLIWATGFQASKFLAPMQVTGRAGADLHVTWGGDARAYLGIVVPGFPNLFLLYGPNTNIVINGSIIYFSELEVRYVLGAIRLLLETGRRALDVRQEVHDEFNIQVDAANRAMAWGASSVNSWYKNETGRVSQNWPYSLLEYWRRSRAPDPADFELL